MMAVYCDLIWDVKDTQPENLNCLELIQAVAGFLQLDQKELAVRVVDEETMVQANSKYRQKEYVTDVLSFPPAWESSAELAHLGDLLICWPRTIEQAGELEQSVEVEFRFLLLHGLLHLLGYDHETDHGEMLELQKKIRMALVPLFS